MPEPSPATTTRIVLSARAELLADLGHEPTLTAVAAHASLPFGAVRRAYLREGLATQAGLGAAKQQRVIAARAQLLAALGREPTQTEVCELLGIVDGGVSKIYAKLGIDPRAGVRAKVARTSALTRLPAARQALRAELGRAPNQSEIAKAMGLSRQRVSQLVQAEGAK